MSQANIPQDQRHIVWTEAMQTAMHLDGLIQIKVNGKMATKYEHWAGENPSFAKHLRVWGEAGTVKTNTQ